MTALNVFIQTFARLFYDMAPYILLGLGAAGVLNIFFSKEFVQKKIGSRGAGSAVKASLLGVPLPLCSCGVVPTAVYLKKSGASDGAVSSFLISTPQTGADSIAATYALMGPFMAFYRPLVAFLSGIFGGMLVEVFGGRGISGGEEHPGAEAGNCCSGSGCPDIREKGSGDSLSFGEKIKGIFSYGFGELMDDIAGHFLLGIILASVITMVIPDDFFVSAGISSGLPAMLVMAVAGIPLYVCSTSSIPIALSLMMKGISPGAAFVFLFAGPVTNTASLIVLVKSLGRRVTGVYIAAVTLSAVVFGLFLDFLAGYRTVVPESFMTAHEHYETTAAGLFFSLVFASLLVRSLYGRHVRSLFLQKKTVSPGSREEVFHVPAMTCGGCAAKVRDALLESAGVERVEADIDTKTVRVTVLDRDRESLKEIIRRAGY